MAEHEQPASETPPTLASADPVGPIVRIMGYENASLVFDEILHQNIATRQIFTKHHYRPDGSVLSIVVELPETYSHYPPAAEKDLSQVSIYDLLDEIRRRVNEVEADCDAREASDG